MFSYGTKPMVLFVGLAYFCDSLVIVVVDLLLSVVALGNFKILI